MVKLSAIKLFIKNNTPNRLANPRQKNEEVAIKYIETSKNALKFQEKLIKNKSKKKENNTTFRIDFALAM